MNKQTILGAVLGMALLLPGWAAADEKVPVDKLPQAVRAAIEQRFPGAELLKAERDVHRGQIEYEVKLRHEGRRYEVEVLENGEIRDIDRDD